MRVRVRARPGRAKKCLRAFKAVMLRRREVSKPSHGSAEDDRALKGIVRKTLKAESESEVRRSRSGRLPCFRC